MSIQILVEPATRESEGRVDVLFEGNRLSGLDAEHRPRALPLFEQTFSIEDGEMVLPGRPGLGTSIGLTAIEWLQPNL